MESFYEKRPCNCQSFSLKIHKSFENLKVFYYFDMIRQGVLDLWTLYTTLFEFDLETHRLYLRFSQYSYTVCFPTFK